MNAFFEMLQKLVDVFASRAEVNLLNWMPELDGYMIILLASLIIIAGILQCFLGFKSFKVWCSFIGLIIGVTLGLIFVLALSLYESEFAMFISIFFVVCLALIGAFIAYRAYLVGIFLYAFLTLFSLCYFPLSNVTDPVIIAVIIGLCAGIAGGVVAVIIQRISIITATCVSGALFITGGMMLILEGTGTFTAVVLPCLAALICAAGGFFVQLKTTEKKPVPQQPVQVAFVPVQGTVGAQPVDGTVAAVPVAPVAPVAPAAPAAEAPAPAPEQAPPAEETPKTES